MKAHILATMGLGLALLATACDGGNELALRGVAVSFATQSPTAAGTAPSFSRTAALDDTVTSGADTLIISRVEIVLREIELEREDIDDCDAEPEPAGCEDVEAGPVLVDLPLTAGARQEFSIQIPTGIYTEIEFDIHKVDTDDAAQFPNFPLEQSIRVVGAFNGVAFEFTSDLNVEQELDLVPNLVVQEGGAGTNITIFVDLDAWFRRADGTLVDPATANKGAANENLVRDNIIASMEAFEDADGDGDDD